MPFKRGKEFKGIKFILRYILDIWMIPDGAFTFHEANEEKINVTI